MVHAELLSIGSELLAGETVDTNAAFLGRAMAAIGLPIRSVRALPDDRAVIRDGFVEARSRGGVVLATGGLGPTHDDLTREGLADALDEQPFEDAALLNELAERFAAYGRMPATNRRQATLVPSAEPLPNPIGSAPGWWVDRDGIVVALMPGVPSEMRRMWTDQVRPRLVARFGLPPLAIRTVKAFGIGESAMAERLRDVIATPPAGVEVGIYARDDGVHLRFSAADSVDLDALAADARGLLGSDAYGGDRDDLPTVAMARLGAMGIGTLASWEADTEGALLAVLAGCEHRDGAARFVGGLLDAGGSAAIPVADAVLQLSLLPQDAHGRSRVRVALSGASVMPRTELRIHGSGPQRLRRAAFAALDAVRRL